MKSHPVIHVEELGKFIGQKICETSVIDWTVKWFWMRASDKILNVKWLLRGKETQRENCNFVNNTDLPCLGM